MVSEVSSELADNGDEDDSDSRGVISIPTVHEQDEVCRMVVEDPLVNNAVGHRTEQTRVRAPERVDQDRMISWPDG